MFWDGVTLWQLPLLEYWWRWKGEQGAIQSYLHTTHARCLNCIFMLSECLGLWHVKGNYYIFDYRNFKGSEGNCRSKKKKNPLLNLQRKRSRDESKTEIQSAF